MQWVKIFSDRNEAMDRVSIGATQLLIVHQIRICLARIGNEFYAVDDKCTHNGESLSKGSINYIGEVICPWHGYRFNMKTGREGSERSRDLTVYPIKIDDTGFYLGL